MGRNKVNEETLARWLEAPAEERALVLRVIGDWSKRADKIGQPNAAGTARDAVMLLSDLTCAAAEPEAGPFAGESETQRRDRDWCLAFAKAVGTNSGLHAPLVPDALADCMREAIKAGSK